MKLINDDTNKDAIIAYLKSPDDDIDQLTEKQKSLLTWYTQAYALITNYTAVRDAIRVLVKFSRHNGTPISESTARRYIYDAQDVYGFVSKVKPEAIQHQAINILNDAIAMARDQNDPKTMIMGAKELVAIGGVEKEQPFNPEMMEQHIIEISLDKKHVNVLEKLVGKGSLDLDLLVGNTMNSMAEDAEIIQPENDRSAD